MRTKDPEEALKKYDLIKQQVYDLLNSLILTPESPALQKLENAKKIAKLYGLDYKPAFAQTDDDLVERLEKIFNKDKSVPTKKVASAVFGMDTPAQITLNQLVNQYYMIMRQELIGKNATQIKRWKNARNLYVDNLIKVVGNIPLVELDHTHGLKLRDHLMKRVGSGELVACTANEYFGRLTTMLKVLDKRLQLGINTTIFQGLAFKDQRVTQRPSLSVDWLRKHLIETPANINEESFAVIRIMVNTGCRLNEACGLAEDDIKLDAAVPHIKIRPNKHRQIKNKPSIRDVPLVGVALEGAKKLQELGETNRRYIAKNDSLSGQINKYFKSNNLWEEQGQSIYCMRHSFQDRLIKAEILERVQCDLMGHALYKPRYGAGTDLTQKLEAIKMVAIEGG